MQLVFAVPQGRAGTHRALHFTEQKKKVGSECQYTEVENAFLACGTVDSHSLPRGRVHVLIFAPWGRKTIIVRHPHIARVFLNFSGDRDVMQKHVPHKASARSHYRTFLQQCFETVASWQHPTATLQSSQSSRKSATTSLDQSCPMTSIAWHSLLCS